MDFQSLIAFDFGLFCRHANGSHILMNGFERCWIFRDWVDIVFSGIKTLPGQTGESYIIFVLHYTNSLNDNLELT